LVGVVTAGQPDINPTIGLGTELVTKGIERIGTQDLEFPTGLKVSLLPEGSVLLATSCLPLPVVAYPLEGALLQSSLAESGWTWMWKAGRRCAGVGYL
jgi:hypothetical protein